MPELPEVQTVKNELKKDLIGKKIVDINIKEEKILKNKTKNQFTKEIKGQTIEDIKTKGKYLIFVFKNDLLLIHLRMEGKLFFYKNNYKENIHDHIIFYLGDGSYLVYNDVRKFGTFDYIKKEELKEYPKIKKLGYEPLTKDFSTQNIFEKIHKKNKSIKEVLLDQTNISGLGNIYVDEVLFASKINPLTKANKLNLKDVEKIKNNSEKILKKAIKLKGTTIRSFKSSKTTKGSYQDHLKAYAQKDNDCPRCKTKIKKIKVGGRGTYYCPTCQKEK